MICHKFLNNKKKGSPNHTIIMPIFHVLVGDRTAHRLQGVEQLHLYLRMIAAIVKMDFVLLCPHGVPYQNRKLIYALPTAGDVFACQKLTFSHALDHFQGNRFAPSLVVLVVALTGLLVTTGCAVVGVVHPGVLQCLLKKFFYKFVQRILCCYMEHVLIVHTVERNTQKQIKTTKNSFLPLTNCKKMNSLVKQLKMSEKRTFCQHNTVYY